MAMSGAFSPGAAPVRPRAHGLKAPRLSRYIFGQLIGPVAMLVLLLSSMIWLVKILPLLDLVINRGQSAFTFAYLALLYLPTLLVIILPFALLFGCLFGLQRLSSDSELVVMASAGFSLRQLAMPVLATAALLAAMTYLCNLYLAPAGQRTLNAIKGDIYADVGGALLDEGQFNTAAKGLTVFIKQINQDGSFKDVLVHDSRNAARPMTFIADSGQVVQTPAGGARLLMFNGTVQNGSGSQLSTLTFKSYPLNLDQFAAQAGNTLRRKDDRYLPELLSPPEKGLSQQTRDAFTAEAHNRLSQPLNCFAFALIALAAVTRGRRARGMRVLRLVGGALAAIGLYLAGFAVAGAAQSRPELLPAFYVIPFAGMAGAVMVLSGYSPAAILARWRTARAAA